MKKLSLLLAVVLVFTGMSSLFVSAAGTTKGVSASASYTDTAPTIDGQIDTLWDAYGWNVLTYRSVNGNATIMPKFKVVHDASHIYFLGVAEVNGYDDRSKGNEGFYLGFYGADGPCEECVTNSKGACETHKHLKLFTNGTQWEAKTTGAWAQAAPYVTKSASNYEAPYEVDGVNCYVYEVAIKKTAVPNMNGEIGLEVVYGDHNATSGYNAIESFSWSKKIGGTGNYDILNSPNGFGTLVLEAPVAKYTATAPTIDGQIDEIWNSYGWNHLTYRSKASGTNSMPKFKIINDADKIYLLCVADVAGGYQSSNAGQEGFFIGFHGAYDACSDCVKGTDTRTCDTHKETRFFVDGSYWGSINCSDSKDGWSAQQSQCTWVAGFKTNSTATYEVDGVDSYVYEIAIKKTAVPAMAGTIGLEVLYLDASATSAWKLDETFAWAQTAGHNDWSSNRAALGNPAGYGAITLEAAPPITAAYVGADNLPTVDGLIGDSAWDSVEWNYLTKRKANTTYITSPEENDPVKFKIINSDSSIYILFLQPQTLVGGYDIDENIGIGIYGGDGPCVECELAGTLQSGGVEHCKNHKELHFYSHNTYWSAQGTTDYKSPWVASNKNVPYVKQYVCNMDTGSDENGDPAFVYEIEISKTAVPNMNGTIGLELVYNDRTGGDAETTGIAIETFGWSQTPSDVSRQGTMGNQAGYGLVTLEAAPAIANTEAAPTIDGEVDAVWDTVTTWYTLNNKTNGTDDGISNGTAAPRFKIMNDCGKLYLLAEINDATMGNWENIGIGLHGTCDECEKGSPVAGMPTACTNHVNLRYNVMWTDASHTEYVIDGKWSTFAGVHPKDWAQTNAPSLVADAQAWMDGVNLTNNAAVKKTATGLIFEAEINLDGENAAVLASDTLGIEFVYDSLSVQYSFANNVTKNMDALSEPGYYAEYPLAVATGDHTTTAIPAVGATCTTTGLTAGVKCSDCGVILTAPETTDKLPHAAAPGTWTTDAYTHTATCATCPEIITGIHTGEGTCDVCGATFAAFKHGLVGDFFYEYDALVTGYRVYEYEGATYFIGDGNAISKNKVYKLTNGSQNWTGETGYYAFGPDGKMYGADSGNVVCGDYAFVNGVQVRAYGWFTDNNGEYYFVSDAYRIIKNKALSLNRMDGAEGYRWYYFGLDGKLFTETTVMTNDRIFIDGVQQGYGLYEAYTVDAAGNLSAEANYFYVVDYHVIGKNVTLYVNNPEYGPAGFYSFDANGHIIVE